MSGDDVRDELEAIVRDLAGVDPEIFDCQSQSYWCAFCLREPRQGSWGVVDGRNGADHASDCLYIRAQQAVERLDATRQPVEAPIRIGAGHIPIARALNRKARENPGSACPNPPS